MKYLVVFIPILLGTAELPERKQVKEIREYTVTPQPDGTSDRLLERHVTFTPDGNVLSKIEFGRIGSCGQDSVRFTSYERKYEYKYQDSRVVQEIYWRCDSVPDMKKFYTYKLDGLGRIVESTDSRYTFERRRNKSTFGDSTRRDVLPLSVQIQKERNRYRRTNNTLAPNRSF